MLVEKIDYKNDFSLVLSGGGALGISQLGVISDLEEKEYIPSEIIGTSMGGLIGACLSIGLNYSEIFEIFESKIGRINKILSFSMKGNSIITSRKIKPILKQIFGDIKINETKIPLKIITTNFNTGEKRTFSNKDSHLLIDILLATMAIPGVFEEQIIDNETYVDGFLCENLGISEAIYDNVLAIDVLGENSYIQENPKSIIKTIKVFGMIERSMRLLIINQTKKLIINSNKNIQLVDINTSQYKTFSFNDYDSIEKLGYDLI